MNFFFDPDWLNRPGPSYSFKLDHLLFILFAVLITVGLAILLRKKDKQVIKVVLISLWVLAIAIEVFYYAVIYTRCIIDESYKFNIETMLPFHSCSMFMFIFPFAMFSKNKHIKLAANNFLVIVNMIMGFITMFVGCPGPGNSALSFFGLVTLTYHAIIFMVPFVMVFTNYYDLQKNDWKWGLSLFGILATAMWIFDACTGSDYFYHYDGHNFGVLYVISENVHHLVWTLIVVSCYVITALVIHFLIFGIKWYLAKKKVEQN